MPDNDLLRRTLYTGMSRAKMGLIVVAHEGTRNTWILSRASPNRIRTGWKICQSEPPHLKPC